MTTPTARAIASVGVSAGCAAVAFAEPMMSALAVAGIMVSIYFIWGGR